MKTKTDWKNAHSYSIKLNDEENARFLSTGIGVKKLFRTMLDALAPPVVKVPTEKIVVEEEE